MISRRFSVAYLRVDGIDVRLRYGDLLVAQHEGATEIDWECVVMPVDPAPMEQGAYRIEVDTVDARVLAGDAVLVRSVQGTHVLRGAGPLAGLHDSDV